VSDDRIVAGSLFKDGGPRQLQTHDHQKSWSSNVEPRRVLLLSGVEMDCFFSSRRNLCNRMLRYI